MKLIVLVLAFASLVVTAGYLGLAPLFAEVFKVATFAFGAAILAGLLAGGIRISGRRSAAHLMPRVRRTAA